MWKGWSTVPIRYSNNCHVLKRCAMTISSFFNIIIVSHPVLLLWLGEYWFRISRYVYDRNRPLAPILRQSRCSLMYDVYLTCIDDDEQVLHVHRDWNTWNTIQDQNWIFFFWTTINEWWKSKRIQWKQSQTKDKRKSWTTNKINEQLRAALSSVSFSNLS